MAKDKQKRHVPHKETQINETPEQKQAFETYFMMGDGRSYRKLAKQLGKGVTTISNWSKKFDWQERIDHRDGQVNQIVEEKNNKTMAEIKMEQATLIDATMQRFWEQVRKGKVELDNWQDFERLWKIRMDIGGDNERKRSNALNDMTNAIARVGKSILGDDE